MYPPLARNRRRPSVIAVRVGVAPDQEGPGVPLSVSPEPGPTFSGYKLKAPCGTCGVPILSQYLTTKLTEIEILINC